MISEVNHIFVPGGFQCQSSCLKDYRHSKLILIQRNRLVLFEKNTFFFLSLKNINKNLNRIKKIFYFLRAFFSFLIYNRKILHVIPRVSLFHHFQRSLTLILQAVMQSS